MVGGGLGGDVICLMGGVGGYDSVGRCDSFVCTGERLSSSRTRYILELGARKSLPVHNGLCWGHHGVVEKGVAGVRRGRG